MGNVENALLAGSGNFAFPVPKWPPEPPTPNLLDGPRVAQDSSYMSITDDPYLYYVRMDGNHPPYQRVLFRQKIKLDWLTPLHH
jgi:hypothetical protein